MSDPAVPDPAVSDPTGVREAAPAALVGPHGYRFGTYDGPIAEINPLDVVTATGPAGAIERLVRNARMKEWEAFQLGNDDWFVLGAVYDTKSISLLQVLAVHKQSGRILRWEQKVPTTSVSVARGLDGTRSHGRSGAFSIDIGNEMGLGHISIHASHPGRAAASGSQRPDLPALELHGVADCSPSAAAHLVICHPFAADRALYSHKAMMSFDGSMRIGSEVITLDPDRSFMILDDHHGDYPSPMQYDWVTAARRSPTGVIEGFNLTDNQVLDPERYNENAVWRGNELFRLPAVHVDRPDGPHGPWLVRDSQGQVDVRFQPTVRSEMHVGPRRLLAEYYAPYGWYSGTIDTGAFVLDVDGFFGVGEQKMIRV